MVFAGYVFEDFGKEPCRTHYYRKVRVFFRLKYSTKKIAYTALGHLHRTQRVLRHENARYAGAPLPMLFVEKNNKEGVTEENIID